MKLNLKLDRRILAAAVAISLIASAPALGAALSVSKAGKAASAYGQTVRKQLHASSLKVAGCHRVSAGRVACHAEARFTSGARRCTFEVIVSSPTAKGTPPRTSPANFVCY
jgi:hypothetical protein